MNKRFIANKYLPVALALAAFAAAGTAPAFAATNGGYSNDSGNLMASYYDKNGWHIGLPPEARAARAAPQQSERPGRGPSRGLSAYGSIALQNDWFWGGSRS
jgi:hypothetical protein